MMRVIQNGLERRLDVPLGQNMEEKLRFCLSRKFSDADLRKVNP